MVIETVKGCIRLDDSGHVCLMDMFEHYGGGNDMKRPDVWLRARGVAECLFVAPDVALAYAAHLNRMLHAQLSASLGAAEEAEKREANKDKELREFSRMSRKVFTNALASCGVHEEADVRRVSRLIYDGALGASTGNLYREYGAKNSLRDVLPPVELMTVAMAENNASVRLYELGANPLPAKVDKVVHEAAKAVAALLDYQRTMRVG